MTPRRTSLGVALGSVLAVLASACSSGAAPHGSAAPSSTAPSAPSSSGRPSSSPSPTGPPPLHRRVLSWRLPGPLSRSVAMRYHGGVLVAGGLEPGDVSSGAVMRIDLHRGVVGHLPMLAEPLHDSSGLVLRGRPTVFGGGGAVELADVQQLAPGGSWHVVGRLPTARSDLSAVGGAGAAYLVGGYDGVHTPPEVLRTRDGSTYTKAATLPGGDRYAGVLRVGHQLWVFGGEVAGAELDRVARIDLRTGSVRTVGRMPVPIGHEAVVRVGPRVLVMGGRTAPESVTNAMWWYDLRTGRWTRAGRLPYPVADAPLVTQGHAAYLLGGETPGFTSNVTRVSW